MSEISLLSSSLKPVNRFLFVCLFNEHTGYSAYHRDVTFHLRTETLILPVSGNVGLVKFQLSLSLEIALFRRVLTCLRLYLFNKEQPTSSDESMQGYKDLASRL